MSVGPRPRLDPTLAVVTALLLALVAAHAGFVRAMWDTQPGLGLVPPVPGQAAVEAMGFGDAQFLYRVAVLEIQNAGDTGGRFTPLAEYDYGRLAGWFERLEALDPTADFLPAVAGYYYGLTPVADDVGTVVRFLQRHAGSAPCRKWRWLAYATYLARHRKGDQDLALTVARDLADVAETCDARAERIPIWTRQMQAFILADLGDTTAARELMQAILATDPSVSPQERRYMEDFIQRR